MKLAVTEKFFWDLYKLVTGIEDAQPLLFTQPFTIKKAVCPDFYRLKRTYEKKQRRENFSKLISYLKSKGWIKIKELQEKKALVVTPKGKEKILKVRNKFLLSLPKKKRKDGKWIMVAFDVPEKKRAIRNYFREKIVELGFQKFQQSIWISPYDTLKEVKRIIQNLGIEKGVGIFLIEEAEI